MPSTEDFDFISRTAHRARRDSLALLERCRDVAKAIVTDEETLIYRPVPLELIRREVLSDASRLLRLREIFSQINTLVEWSKATDNEDALRRTEGSYVAITSYIWSEFLSYWRTVPGFFGAYGALVDSCFNIAKDRKEERSGDIWDSVLDWAKKERDRQSFGRPPS